MHQLNIQDAIDATLAGIRQAGENAGERWKDEAKVQLTIMARTRPTLTATDLSMAMERSGLVTPTLSAVGPVMLWGRKMGLIERTGEYVASARASRHLNPMRVWKSLVFAAN